MWKFYLILHGIREMVINLITSFLKGQYYCYDFNRDHRELNNPYYAWPLETICQAQNLFVNKKSLMEFGNNILF